MVAFKTLWRNHPVNRSEQTPCIVPRDMVVFGDPKKRGVPTFGNQCAIRMGVALRNAGVTPAQMGNIATCSVHDRDAMHFIRAAEVAAALARANIEGLGKVERYSGKDAAQFYSKLFGRTGIIYIKDYWYRNPDERAKSNPTGDHVDVWNGFRPTTKWLMEWFSWLGYYSNYVGAKEIWFWEVK